MRNPSSFFTLSRVRFRVRGMIMMNSAAARVTFFGLMQRQRLIILTLGIRLRLTLHTDQTDTDCLLRLSRGLIITVSLFCSVVLFS